MGAKDNYYNIYATPKNVHEGHRQRLKDKVRKAGFDILSDHEKLELMLTYSIPFKDTNGLAHNLINHFGSFANVFDADYRALMEINGIGEETALFIKICNSFMDSYKKSKNECPGLIFNNPKDVVTYFRKNYNIKSKEHFYLFAFNAKQKLIHTKEIVGENQTTITINLKDITEVLMGDSVCYLIAIHTHPDGSAEPSNDDMVATERLVDACSVCGVTLVDHYIITENSEYSFKNSNQLDKFTKKYSLITNNGLYKTNKLTKSKIPVDED